MYTIVHLAESAGDVADAVDRRFFSCCRNKPALILTVGRACQRTARTCFGYSESCTPQKPPTGLLLTVCGMEQVTLDGLYSQLHYIYWLSHLNALITG